MSQVSVLLKNIWQSSKRKRTVCEEYAKPRSTRVTKTCKCVETKARGSGSRVLCSR